MKGYRKPNGIYLEVQDNTPVSDQLVPVALRTSLNHVFSDTWNTDTMDPAVCWRLKTAAEQTVEKDTALQEFLDSAGGKVVKAIILVGIEKGYWTLAELRTKFRTL